MKYMTTNEFAHFGFGEAHVGDIQLTDGFFRMELDNVMILPENSCNRDIRTMRTNNLLFKVQGGKVESLIREGVKIYDANGNFKEQTSDVALPREEYKDAAEQIADGYIFSAEKEEADGAIRYTFLIDGTDDCTYCLKVDGSGDTEEWDRFMNPESM